MNKRYNFHSFTGYQKNLTRLEKNIRSGRFALYTQQKKQLLWNRLCRYARQSGIQIKASLITACIVAGLCLATPANAQTFTEQTGSSNPFNGVNGGHFAAPVFADIDGDGDLDAFIGNYGSPVLFYKNTGSATAPVFTLQADAANPLFGLSPNYITNPSFVDIDGDGDLDLFVTYQSNYIRFYKNTGTATAPVFTLQTGAANLFNGFYGGYNPVVAFADIDGDGDKDAFVSTTNSTVSYYKNTGTATAPGFVLQTGAANPLDGISATPVAFADLDKDGDLDAIAANYGGTVSYYKNTGTPTAPVFTLQTGATDPLDGDNFGYSAYPVFADIDGDGDQDLFVANYYGTIYYYKNTSAVLPLTLISFSGHSQSNYNHLQWQTAYEYNTKSFNVEISSDGTHFSTIATVPAAGNGNNHYSIDDHAPHSGKVFYRLQMTDIDGKFTYSGIIWLRNEVGTKINIYPNPVNDIINVNIGSALLLKTTAGLYDAGGRLLQIITITNNLQQISVDKLAKGIYQLRFTDGSVRSFIKN